MRTYTCDPKLEVAGMTVTSFIDNLASNNIKELVERHGLDNIDSEKWYPVQKVFDLFNEIVESQSGNTQPFVAMGMKIAEQSEFPPEMKASLTLPMILNGWQDHYQANHRGASFPPVETVMVNDKHYQLVCQADHIYPFDLVYGMAFGFCRLLLPKGTDFLVKYDDKHTPYGDFGDKVIINISWS